MTFAAALLVLTPFVRNQDAAEVKTARSRLVASWMRPRWRKLVVLVLCLRHVRGADEESVIFSERLGLARGQSRVAPLIVLACPRLRPE